MPEPINIQIHEQRGNPLPILLSNEVKEIISSKPVWIVQNGTILFLIIICSLISLTFFISYPDVVIAKAKLSSINAPKEIKTKIDGKLLRLDAKEGEFVKKGQLLGFMESRADTYEIITLSKIIDSLQSAIENCKTEISANYFLPTYKQLGEAQQGYQTFMQSFILFKQYLSSGYYLKKKAMLKNDISYVMRLHETLLQQKKLQQEYGKTVKEEA